MTGEFFECDFQENPGKPIPAQDVEGAVPAAEPGSANDPEQEVPDPEAGNNKPELSPGVIQEQLRKILSEAWRQLSVDLPKLMGHAEPNFNDEWVIHSQDDGRPLWQIKARLDHQNLRYVLVYDYDKNLTIDLYVITTDNSQDLDYELIIARNALDGTCELQYVDTFFVCHDPHVSYHESCTKKDDDCDRSNRTIERVEQDTVNWIQTEINGVLENVRSYAS